VGETGVGAFFLVINPEGIMDPALFKTLLSEYVVNMKGSESSELFMPGEIEQNSEIRSSEEGIEMDEMAIETLNTLLKDAASELTL